jgi:hypothetical protein
MTKRLALIAVMMLPLVAQAMTYFLTDQWLDGSNRMCKYSNGTILNVGAKVCPTKIEG